MNCTSSSLYGSWLDDVCLMDHHPAPLAHWLPSWITMWLLSHYGYCHGPLSCYARKTLMANQNHKHMELALVCVVILHGADVSLVQCQIDKFPDYVKKKNNNKNFFWILTKLQNNKLINNHYFILLLAQTLHLDWPLERELFKRCPSTHTQPPTLLSLYLFLSLCPLISHQGVCAKRSDDPQSSAPASTWVA